MIFVLGEDWEREDARVSMEEESGEWSQAASGQGQLCFEAGALRVYTNHRYKLRHELQALLLWLVRSAALRLSLRR